MTGDLHLFALMTRITMPIFSVGPIEHAYKARRRRYGQSPALDQPFASTDDGILYHRHGRQSVALLDRGPGVGSTAPIAAWIERP